jgi:hypothetical protein
MSILPKSISTGEDSSHLEDLVSETELAAQKKIVREKVASQTVDLTIPLFGDN